MIWEVCPFVAAVSAGCGLAASGPARLKNNGGGPRVSLAARRRSAGCLSPLIWLEGRVSEGSADELHWAIHAWRLLDRMVFDRAHRCFTLTVWFQRERFEAPLAVFSWSTLSRFMVLAANVMKGEI